MAKAESARAPRRFIESQLNPVVQAFGYEGGWSVERHTKAKPLFAGLEWPCARPGCKRMAHRRGKTGTIPKYCSKLCAKRVQKARPSEREKARVRSKAKSAARTPEQKARGREYRAAYMRQWRPGWIARWS